MTGPTPGVSIPVHAPCDGTIRLTSNLPGYAAYGLGVAIFSNPDSTGRRREVVLGHQVSLAVQDGQYIHLGDLIGMMGESGAATGLHVHLGLRFHLSDGTVQNHDNGFHGWTDPEPYLIPWGDKGLFSYPNG